MGIKIINSFDLNSPLPLDARAVANNINEMNELITKNFVVAGQMCYNKADNKLYVLKKNSEGALLSWHEVADNVDLDNINKVLPTDIAVKDNKLGLEHDNVWLTNQNAINLGDNMTYDATTKTLNAKGGGGGESVSPTLNLMDIEKNIARTTITEQEKNNLEKGLYNQVVYVPNLEGLNFLVEYSPSKLILSNGTFSFAIVDGIVAESEEQLSLTTITVYDMSVGEKNASGEYPITIEKVLSFNLGSGSGGSSEIPTLSTIAPSISDLATTVYSDNDIALIKKQKDNFIKVPFGTADDNTSELCYVFYFNNAYSLMDVAGNLLSFANAFADAPNFLYFNLDETTKKLTRMITTSLSNKFGLYFDKNVANSLIFANGNNSIGFTVNGDIVYFDTVNGKPILHKDSTINNYDLGKSINLFGNHSILVPNASADTEINLYNHFIKITGTKDTTQVIARFTIQSSNNLVVDTPEKLVTLLGNEFELGCNGIYGNYNITGLKKTADGALNIIYNNGGAESLQSVASLTISISDTVKTV